MAHDREGSSPPDRIPMLAHACMMARVMIVSGTLPHSHPQALCLRLANRSALV